MNVEHEDRELILSRLHARTKKRIDKDGTRGNHKGGGAGASVEGSVTDPANAQPAQSSASTEQKPTHPAAALQSPPVQSQNMQDKRRRSDRGGKETATLTRGEALEILSGIARDTKARPETRAAAIAKVGDLEGWALARDNDGPPDPARLVAWLKAAQMALQSAAPCDNGANPAQTGDDSPTGA